jgi:hypothetical protein
MPPHGGPGWRETMIAVLALALVMLTAVVAMPRFRDQACQAVRVLRRG